VFSGFAFDFSRDAAEPGHEQVAYAHPTQ
jgi:hypothetical protein